MSQFITVSIEINERLDLVWEKFTRADHIVNWYFASPSWHAPSANVDFVDGGMFSIRMEAWDKSFGFDYKGKFQRITPMKSIQYILEDQREVLTSFTEYESAVKITQTFESEDANNLELQKQGWQATLESFKRYVETDFLIFESHIDIHASQEVIWDSITQLEKYQIWTKAFSENAIFHGQWRQGETLDFITPNRGGTRVLVDALIPNNSIHLVHTAVITPDNQSDSTSPSAKPWVNTIENYELINKDNIVTFVAHIECHRSFYDFMKSSWDKALVDLKSYNESQV